MALHKFSRGIDFSSKEWRDYCLWRNYSFTGFDSLDSTLRDSFFSPSCDEDWTYAVTNGDFVTDIISDDTYAFAVARKLGAKEILNFDAIENGVTDKIVGYDILDGGHS